MPSPPLTDNSQANAPQGGAQTAPVSQSSRHKIVLLVLLALVLAAFLIPFLFLGQRTYRVPGASMEPTLMGHDAGRNEEAAQTFHETIHDQIQVSSSAYWLHGPQFGDIIVLIAPKKADIVSVIGGQPQQEKLLVKRVVGLPGDTIEIRQGTVLKEGAQVLASNVYRNGKPLTEYTDGKPPGYIKEPMLAPPPGYSQYGVEKPLKLGQDEYYVLGDNRNDSNDSRYWGPLERRRIIGKVTAILSPSERKRAFP